MSETLADHPSAEDYRNRAERAEQEATELRQSVAEEWNHYMTGAVSSAPEPLRQLGEFLAGVLDEDHWKTAERYLNSSVLEATELREQIARLREALGHYASAKSWHWNGKAWEWNGSNSAYFKGCETARDTEYPGQSAVDAECGAIARSALENPDAN